MYIPLLRERVRMTSRSGEFIVIRANYESQHADLIAADGAGDVLERTSFSKLFAPWEVGSSEAAAGVEMHPPPGRAVKDPSARESA